jgi:hypothetical protein
MGGTDKRQAGERRQQERQGEEEDSDQESNETMPINSVAPLPI